MPQLCRRVILCIMAILSSTATFADTVTHFRPTSPTGVYPDVRTLLDLVGIGRTNIQSETVATYFTVPGSNENVDLEFNFRRDTGTFNFTFGFYDISQVTADPITDKMNYAIQALTIGTLVFDDRTVNPGATATRTVPAGTQLGFWLIPNARVVDVLTNPQAFFQSQRWPLFSVADANPGQFDQMLSFVGNGVTLFTFEDLTRTGSSDQDFTDLAFTINIALIPTFPPPTITILGDNPFIQEFGQEYADQGATAVDDRGLDITDRITVVSTVDVFAIGQYTVTYNVIDDFGASDSAVRNVSVVDTVPPVLTPNGPNPITLPAGVIFIDPGCGCSDNADGDISGNVIVEGGVNVNVPGIYVITYTCSDSSGNAGIPVTRTVVVEEAPIDTTPPVITLIGSPSISIPFGSPFNDPGATCFDNVDGDISGSIVVDNPVNTNVPGTYVITYTCVDSSGNPAETVTRTVIVQAQPDLVPPIITLIGAPTITIPFGGLFNDPGATCLDNVDGDITGSIVVTNPVDVNTPGTYVVTYNCTDASGNPAEPVQRTVTVEEEGTTDSEPPVITLIGPPNIQIPLGEPFVDPGAICIDNVDGDISVNIVVVGSVDVNTPGTYTLTYRCVDAAGNPAEEITRTVRVLPEGENVCESFRDALRNEWQLMAADLNLRPNIACVPRHRIPERWALAMISCVLCREQHPHHVRTLTAYRTNLETLELEPPDVVARIQPYRHVLAGMLMLNTRRVEYFKDALGLTQTYVVARRMGREVSEEFYADDGDLDGDGVENAVEYNYVVARGGDYDDFAEEAAERGTVLPVRMTFAVLAALILAILGVLYTNRLSFRGRRAQDGG